MRTFFCIFSIFILNVNIIQSQTEEKNWALNGYVKDLQSFIYLSQDKIYLSDNLIHNRLNFVWYPNDAWTVKAELRNRFFYGDQIRLNPDYGAQLDDANKAYFDLSVNWLDKNSLIFNSNIDRLYLQYSKGDWDVRIGRQRINWGISTTWNPNDIFNASSFTDFDYEEQPGSDAVLARYYINQTSSFEIAMNVFDDIKEATIAGLYKWNKNNYDFQLLGAYHKQDLVLGFGWAGNIKNSGLKGEASYFYPLEKDTDWGLSISAGIDYSFENGLYINSGFLYNQLGDNQSEITNLFQFDLSAKNLYPFKFAFVESINYSFSPILTGGITLVYSPAKSQPVFISPQISYSVSQNFDLSFVGQLMAAKSDDVFSIPVYAFFLRMKYSF